MVLNEKELQDEDLIASKLLIYLWDDVVRYNRKLLFLIYIHSHN